MKTIGAQILALLFFLWLAWALTLAHTPPPNTTCENCNVIIIGVDTLRADRIHAFGYERETTPNIDALIRTSVSFTNTLSASSWTVPSFMSVFTGAYPSVHKVVNKYVTYDPANPSQQVISNLEKLSPGMMTLAEAMQEAGYATGGFTGDAGVGRGFGYAKGYDVYTDETTFGGLSNSRTRALAWLDTLEEGQKFFMFFHGYDLHGQFKLPEEQPFLSDSYAGPHTGSPQDEAYLREAQLAPEGITLTPEDVAFWNGLYDSKIRAADQEVGAFLKELEARGLMKNTLIVLLSDHGEEYYEHGGIDHGHTLYGELVHVPLVIQVPGVPAATVKAQVSTMDVAPTIFEILGSTPPASYAAQQQGQSLVPYLEGTKDQGRDVFMETDYRDFTHKRAIRSHDGWSYIYTLETKAEELYNLHTDPGEQTNLITENRAKADELKTKLFAHITNTLQADPHATPVAGCLPVYVGECQ